MLDEFIAANRDAIILRTRARVTTRTTPKASDAELTNGIPVFLDQLIEAEAQAQTICMATGDFRRAFEAFAAKRKPVFEGN